MTKKPVMTEKDYRTLAVFRRALREFLAFSAKGAARVGLTPAQHQALLAIKGMPPPVSVGALGLVEKTVDPTDRRRITLTLTAKAERKLVTVSAHNREELRRLAPAL